MRIIGLALMCAVAAFFWCAGPVWSAPGIGAGSSDRAGARGAKTLSVTNAMPARVTLAPGGGAVVVELQGTGLDRPGLNAVVLRNGNPDPSVKAAFDPAANGGTSRRLRLSATAMAVEGNCTARLEAGADRADISLAVTVAAAGKPPVPANPAAKGGVSQPPQQPSGKKKQFVLSKLPTKSAMTGPALVKLRADLEASETAMVNDANRDGDLMLRQMKPLGDAALAAAGDNAAVLNLPPLIEGLDKPKQSYSPGMYLVIRGRHFRRPGDTGWQTTVTMDGKELPVVISTSGNPSVSPTLVIVKIPDNLKGIPDKTAKIQVHAYGKSSNDFPIKFRARREIQEVESKYVERLLCARTGGGTHYAEGLGYYDYADIDTCDWWKEDTLVQCPVKPNREGMFMAIKQHNIRALHETRMVEDPVFGMDQYKIPLLNGFTIKSCSSTYVGEPGYDSMGIIFCGPAAAGSGLVQVVYSDSYAGLAYGVTVAVEGPAGLSYAP